jgi:cytoskeletal protein CcmA (bactofilin family)
MFRFNNGSRERESQSRAQGDAQAVVERGDTDVVAVADVGVDPGLADEFGGLNDIVASTEALGGAAGDLSAEGLADGVAESVSGDRSIDDIHAEINSLGAASDFPASFGRIAAAAEVSDSDEEKPAVQEPTVQPVEAAQENTTDLDPIFTAIWSNNMNAAHDQFLSIKDEGARGPMVSPESPMYCTEQQIYQAQQGIKLSLELVKKGNVHTIGHRYMDIEGDVRLREGTGASLSGKVNGNVVVEGEGVLYLQSTAVITGCVVAPYIICEGQIEGEVFCNRLMAGETAVLKSDVEYAGNFVTLPGSDFSGRVKKDVNALANGYKVVQGQSPDASKPRNVTSASFVSQASQIAANAKG